MLAVTLSQVCNSPLVKGARLVSQPDSTQTVAPSVPLSSAHG